MESIETEKSLPPKYGAATDRHPTDRPLYIAGFGSIAAAVAAVPVLVAVLGDVEPLMLLVFPAIVIGVIAGFVGLLVAGLLSSAARAWRVVRARGARRRRVAAETPRGRLAFD